MINAIVSLLLVAAPAFSQDTAAPAPAATSAAAPTPNPSATPLTPEQIAAKRKADEAKQAEDKRRAEAQQKEDDEGYGKMRGLLGPVTFGPAVTFLGFPHPFEAAAEFKYKDLFGLQFTYGLIPTVTVSSVSVKMHDTDVRLRWYPFRGAFYLGVALFGRQTINATKTQTVASIPVTANLQLTNNFYTPQLGWRWEWHSGFFVGVDLGWQIDSGAKTTISDNAPAAAIAADGTDYNSLTSNVTTQGNNLGNKGLPSFTLLHIGFLF